LKVDDNDESVASPIMVDIADSNRTDVTVGGLQPDMTYQFQVLAYTRKGDGDRSKPKKIKTKGAGTGADESHCWKSLYC